MGAFRCVSDTKHHSLCSLLPFHDDMLQPTCKTCSKINSEKNCCWVLSFCSFLLIFSFISSWSLNHSFLFSFLIYLSSHSKLHWMDLNMHGQSNRFHICCWAWSVKPKPYATNWCKLPQIQIISSNKKEKKNLCEFKASLIHQPFLFCAELANGSLRLGLLSWSQTL